MWLGEQITAKGVGNGISMIIFIGIIAGLPRGVVTIYNLIMTSSGFSPWNASGEEECKEPCRWTQYE